MTDAERLNALLTLQQWNGAWTLTDELAQLANVTAGQVRTSTSTDLDDTVLGTILAVTIVEERFPEQKDAWQAILSKAGDYLDKQTDQAAVQDATNAVRTLIKS